MGGGVDLTSGDIARLAAFVGKVFLAGAMALLLRELRRTGGPRSLLAAWNVVAVEVVLVLMAALYLEGLHVAVLLDSAWSASLDDLRSRSYSPLYLLFSTLGALVPCAVLAVLARTRGTRWVGISLCALTLLLGGGMAVAGAPADWQAFVNLNRLLTFLRIGAYLTFWVFLAVGRIHPVDPYLPAFMAVMTSFSLLLPLQETVFGVFALGEGQVFWTVNQLLQAVHHTVLALICLLLARRLGSGDPPDLLVVGDDRRTPWRVASLSS